MLILTIVLLTHVRMVEDVRMVLTLTNAFVLMVGRATTVRSISTNAWILRVRMELVLILKALTTVAVFLESVAKIVTGTIHVSR